MSTFVLTTQFQLSYLGTPAAISSGPGNLCLGRAVTGHYTARPPRARVNVCKVVSSRRRKSSDAIRS
jgi:hypothetical protein